MSSDEGREKAVLILATFPDVGEFLLHKLGNMLAGAVSSCDLAEMERSETHIAVARERIVATVNWLRELDAEARKFNLPAGTA
jgi:hypothetical protein